jgi:DNA-directed RNA polymerase specialized sigma subunit
MKTTYLIWRTPPSSSATPDWQEISGKEFLALVRSPKSKNRHFIKLQNMDGGDADMAIVMETTKADYLKWKCEKNHADYLRKCQKAITVVSYHSFESDDGECFGEELLPTLNSDVEAQYVNTLLFEAAMASLTDEEQRLIEFLYLSDRRRSVRDYEQTTGIPKSTASRRHKAALEKLKSILED